MKVLVACEWSGVVRDAFRSRGHDAWSCDLEPCAGDQTHHLQMDVLEAIDDSLPESLKFSWDMMIAFPPCTYLCSSGLHWNKRRPERAEKTETSLQFVCALMTSPIPRIAVENPIGCISTKIRKPDQIIQPWQFGHSESKATCLWLQGLPPLVPTNVLTPEWVTNPDGTDYRDSRGKRYSPTHFYTGRQQRGARQAPLFPDARQQQRARWANQTASGQNKLGPSPERARLRGKTYQGIAAAMAEQWGIRHD